MKSFLPEMISTLGVQAAELFALVDFIAILIFALTAGLLILFLILYRHRPGRRAYYYHGNNVLEFTWTFLATLLFAGLGLYSSDLWDRMKYPWEYPEAAVEMEVLGQQFLWHFRYPGADGVFGKSSPELRSPANPFGIDPSDPNGLDDIVVTNEFVIPVNQNVRIKLSSVDVIHSFYLPHAWIKQDAVPGMWIDVWFDSFRTGEFELICAELCGGGHYNMRGVMKVVPQTEFNQWIMEKSAQSRAQRAATAVVKQQPTPDKSS